MLKQGLSWAVLAMAFGGTVAAQTSEPSGPLTETSGTQVGFEPEIELSPSYEGSLPGDVPPWEPLEATAQPPLGQAEPAETPATEEAALEPETPVAGDELALDSALGGDSIAMSAADGSILSDDMDASGQLPSDSNSYQVNNEGAFTYQVPINVPAFRGLVPDLSLVYSSSQTLYASEGPILGIGWSLQGLSTIERVSVGGGMATYTGGADIYRLDGEDLLACTSPGAGSGNDVTTYPDGFWTTAASNSCATGGDYVTRRDNGLRVEGTTDPAFANTSLSGRPMFVVTRPDGVRMTYRSVGALRYETATTGDPILTMTTSDTRVQEAFDQRFVLTRIEDRQVTPNVVTVQYSVRQMSDGLSARPVLITYAGYQIEFNYSEHAENLRTFGTGHASMWGVERTVLRSIEVRNGSTKIRAYGLSYAGGGLFGLDKRYLTSVTEYGNDYTLNTVTTSSTYGGVTGGSALPPVSFSYPSENFNLSWAAQTNATFGRTNIHFFQDIDGNGRDDLIFGPLDSSDPFNDPTRAYQVLSGSAVSTLGFQMPTQTRDGSTWNTTLAIVPVEDGSLSNVRVLLRRQNGVTRSTQVWNGTGTKIWSYTTDSSTTETNVTTGESERALANFQIVAMDRDRKPEFLSLNGSDSMAYELRSRLDDPFTSAPYRSPDFNWAGMSGVQACASGDFDGNGLTDFTGPNGTYFTLEDSIRKSASSLPCPTSSIAYATGDVNADGLDDVVRVSLSNGVETVGVYFSTGDGFLALASGWLASTEAAWSGSTLREPHLVDMNGDGLVDLLLHDAADTDTTYEREAYYFLNTSRAFRRVNISQGQAVLSTASPGAMASYFLGTGDFNGDGLTDVVAYAGSTRDSAIRFNLSPLAHLITRVTTQTGGTIAVNYAPSSDGQGSTATVIGDATPGVRQVVASVTLGDGRSTGTNNDRTTTYRYRDSQYDWTLSRSLGFRTVQQILPSAPGDAGQVVLETTYNNTSYAVAGTVLRQRLTDNGTVLRQTENNHEALGGSGTTGGPVRNQLLGTWTATRYGSAFICSGQLFSYDPQGYRITETDAGMLTCTLGSTASTYTAPSDPSLNGNVVATTAYVRNTGSFIMGLPREIRIRRITDASTNPDTTAAVQARRFFYDNNDSNNSAIPSRGNLTAEWIGEWVSLTTTETSADFKRAALYTYDNWGNVTSSTDARGNTTNYSYDGSKNLFRTGTTNALAQTTSVIWNQGCQRPTRITDPNAQATNFTTDEFCRPTRETNPTTGYTRYEYLDWGIPGSQSIQVSTWSAENGATDYENRTRTYFDGFGETYLTQTTGATNSSADYIYLRETRDNRGRLRSSSIPFKLASATTTNPNPDPLTQATSFTTLTYDALDRLTSQVNPDASKRSVSYAAASLLLSESQQGAISGVSALHSYVETRDEHCWDSDAATACYPVRDIFDHRGLRIRHSLKTEPDLTGDWRSTYYQYDALGRLVGITDPGTSVFVYQYDGRGNLLVDDDPDHGRWTMVYDSANNLTSRVDARGTVISYTYDALNRLASKTVNAPEQLGQETLDRVFIYGYDADTATGEGNKGRLTSIRQHFASATGILLDRVDYDYNPLGLVKREAHQVRRADGTYANQYVFLAEYWPDGAVRSRQFPTAPVSSTAPGYETEFGEFRYDAAGRLRSLGGHITSITYDIWGNPQETVYANGVRETVTSDTKRGWLTRISLTLPTGVFWPGTTSTTTRSHNYTYSENGQVTAYVGPRAQMVFSYTYNWAGQLSRSINTGTCTACSSGMYNQQFKYNAAGSLSEMRTGFTVDATTGAISGGVIRDYVYPTPGPDAAGSNDPDHAPDTVAGGQFGYDNNGNLVSATIGGAVFPYPGRANTGTAMTIRYDGENRPVQVIRDGVTTEYAYAADGTRLSVTTDAASPTDKRTTLTMGDFEQRNFGIAATNQKYVVLPHPNVRMTGIQNSAGEAVLESSYLHRDRLGSVTQITVNSSARYVSSTDVRYTTTLRGQIVTEQGYLPYGDNHLNDPNLTSVIDEDRGWIGQRHDNDTGLQYLNARFYDPELGIFLTPDWFPPSMPGVGTNRYAYSGGDPINRIDPGGNTWLTDVGNWIKNEWNKWQDEVRTDFANGAYGNSSENGLDRNPSGFGYLPRNHDSQSAEHTEFLSTAGIQGLTIGDIFYDYPKLLVEALSDFMDPVAQANRTIAVLAAFGVQQQGYVIAISGGRNLDADQRVFLEEEQRRLAAAGYPFGLYQVTNQMLGMTNTQAGQNRVHAEVKALEYAAGHFMAPHAIATSVNICDVCGVLITASGGVILEPRYAFWVY